MSCQTLQIRRGSPLDAEAGEPQHLEVTPLALQLKPVVTGQHAALRQGGVVGCAQQRDGGRIEQVGIAAADQINPGMTQQPGQRGIGQEVPPVVSLLDA